jgi:hypothetical protein
MITKWITAEEYTTSAEGGMSAETATTMKADGKAAGVILKVIAARKIGDMEMCAAAAMVGKVVTWTPTTAVFSAEKKALIPIT